MPPTATLSRPTGRATQRRAHPGLVLGIILAVQLMVVLDATIVNIALPDIANALNFSPASLSWVITAYTLAFGGFLLLAGRMGDLIGRKRVFLSGLVLFTAASILCGVADSQTMLIVARFIQGIGGAVASAVILAIIVTEFPEASEQAKAMGLVTAAFGGKGGGDMRGLSNHLLVVPSDTTARIQEMHITLGQMLCGALEIELGFASSR